MSDLYADDTTIHFSSNSILKPDWFGWISLYLIKYS
jgi:hypothetical protein